MDSSDIPMPRTHTGSVAVIHRIDATFRPCFLELLQASGVRVRAQRRGVDPGGLIYPYRAHTAAEAVTGAFPGLSGDIVEKGMVKHTLGTYSTTLLLGGGNIRC